MDTTQSSLNGKLSIGINWVTLDPISIHMDLMVSRPISQG